MKCPLYWKEFSRANDGMARGEGTEDERRLKLAPRHEPKASEGLSFAVGILRCRAEDEEEDEEGTHVRLRKKKKQHLF